MEPQMRTKDEIQANINEREEDLRKMMAQSIWVSLLLIVPS
jgi:hypothetical protein